MRSSWLTVNFESLHWVYTLKLVESSHILLQSYWSLKLGSCFVPAMTDKVNQVKHKKVKLSKPPVYKDIHGFLKGVLDIRKVREAQIYRWKEILPHIRGETVTQISSFTSQRYNVLWGLAKSDNITLPREVSFDSPPNFYTQPERWSWGRPKGWWNPKASLLKKWKTRPLISCAPKITQRHEGREYVSGLGVWQTCVLSQRSFRLCNLLWRHMCL